MSQDYDELKKLEMLANEIKVGGLKAIEKIFGVQPTLPESLPVSLRTKHRVSWLEKNNHGISTHRFVDNPHEVEAAKLWNDSNYKSNVLAFLLGDGTHKGVVTERDEVVAATLMQWLGSPVGRSFLAGVNKKFAEVDAKILKKRK